MGGDESSPGLWVPSHHSRSAVFYQTGHMLPSVSVDRDRPSEMIGTASPVSCFISRGKGTINRCSLDLKFPRERKGQRRVVQKLGKWDGVGWKIPSCLAFQIDEI